MEKRTAEIIMICKGNHNYGEELSFKEAIIAYMSDRCCCPIEHYNDTIINKIIWTAAMDYLDNIVSHKPSAFLYSVKEIYDRHNNPFIRKINNIGMYEAICIAFQLVQITEDGEYIDGFTAENTKQVIKGG